ncbi:MAG: HAMP domain-containing sensor histidine kinase [Chloroflexota bacterium]
MLCIRNLWRYIFYLPPFEDKEREAVAKLVLYIFGSGVALGTIASIYYFTIGLWLNFALMTGLVLMVTYSISLVRQDQYEKAFLLTAYMGVFGLIVTVSFNGGLNDPGVMILFPTMVVVSYFSKRRELILLGVALIAWIWALYYIDITEMMGPQVSQIGPFGTAFSLTLILIFSMILLQFTTNQVQSIIRKLRAEKDAAEEASDSKSTFLATMSHELRTPLNAIIGYSEILMEDFSDTEEYSKMQIEDLKRIKASGEHLLSIINDILDLSKIDAKQTDVFLSTFSLFDVLTDVIDSIKPLAAQNNSIVRLDEQKLIENPIYLRSDRIKVSQILQNLLSNAAKYTTNGIIIVNTLVDEQDQAFRITVSDTGIGIAEENLYSIFDPFQQVDSSLSRQFDGTGLGLAISKRLAHLIGAKLTVSSKLGTGSEFKLSFPITVLNSTDVVAL